MILEQFQHSRFQLDQFLLFQACKFIEENLAIQTDTLGPETLLNSARTAMSSKIVGAESDFFAKMVVDAIQSVKTTSAESGKAIYPVKAINVLKAHGKSARESSLLDGYALNMGRASQGMLKRISGGVKVRVLAFESVLELGDIVEKPPNRAYSAVCWVSRFGEPWMVGDPLGEAPRKFQTQLHTVFLKLRRRFGFFVVALRDHLGCETAYWSRWVYDVLWGVIFASQCLGWVGGKGFSLRKVARFPRLLGGTGLGV